MKQLLLLLLCAALHFTANAQSVINSNAYLAHIEKNGQEPMQYLADKICKYSVVAIGEDHWVKDRPMFLCEVIGTLAADTTANIDVLALELGNSIDQKLVNELLNSSEYREDLVLKFCNMPPMITEILIRNMQMSFVKCGRPIKSNRKSIVPRLFC